MIKSRIIGWAGKVARYGENRGAYRVWWRNLGQRYQGVYERIILKWIFTKFREGHGLD
jgi:hypothetical protein